MLHPRRPMTGILGEPVLALGRTYQGIPFGRTSGAMTDVFFLICSVNDRGHLRSLARLSRLLTDSDVLAALRAAEDAAAVHQLIKAAEEELNP